MSSIPLYSKLGIKYQQAYTGPYEDLSFEACDSRMIVAKKDGKLSGFGRPVIALGDSNKLLAWFECLYNATPHIWYMDWLDGGLSKISEFLLKKGLVGKPYYTQVIDLTKTEECLYANLRKSYKQLVRFGSKIIYSSLDNNNQVDEAIEEIKKRKRQDIPKEKWRSDETWEIQKEMIKQKEGFVVTTSQAGAIFLHNKDTCYYGVSTGNNLHTIIWRAILQAKVIGCKEFEMGEQVFAGDQKEINISAFKHGFGGETKVRLEFGKDNL